MGWRAQAGEGSGKDQDPLSLLQADGVSAAHGVRAAGEATACLEARASVHQ